jgi:hypothetical protein
MSRLLIVFSPAAIWHNRGRERRIMQTMNLVLVMLGTAVGSSVLTLGALVLVARIWGRQLLAARIDEAGDLLGSRVRTAVEEAADAVLPRLREQVRLGFAEAADEALPRFRAELDAAADDVLPQFREQVRDGFKDALADAVTGGVLERAGEELARKGGSILETGLGLLLGRDDDEK